jgi:hypothetical protein
MPLDGVGGRNIMKMAKATNDEVERAIEFAGKFDQEIHGRFALDGMSDEELGGWVRDEAPQLSRIIFGYKVLVDNCADPSLDYLEFKPEIKAAMEAAGLST